MRESFSRNWRRMTALLFEPSDIYSINRSARLNWDMLRARRSACVTLIVFRGQLPPLLQTPLQLGFEAAIRGPVIRSTYAQIVLFDYPSRIIVRILVALAVAK